MKRAEVCVPDMAVIFFDLDGTLVDIKRHLRVALGWTTAKRRVALTAASHALKGYQYDGDLWSDLKVGPRERLFRRLLVQLSQARSLIVLPGVRRTLAELQTRGCKMGIVTSRPGDSGRLVARLDAARLTKYFDYIVMQQTDSSRALNKASALTRAARLAGAHVRSCVYVGDEPRDLGAARRACFGTAIAVSSGVTTYDALYRYSSVSKSGTRFLLIPSMRDFMTLYLRHQQEE
jgi:phosphoglycolate phosphatase-like HAD superfamily hydrolase